MFLETLELLYEQSWAQATFPFGICTSLDQILSCIQGSSSSSSYYTIGVLLPFGSFALQLYLLAIYLVCIVLPIYSQSLVKGSTL